MAAVAQDGPWLVWHFRPAVMMARCLGPSHAIYSIHSEDAYKLMAVALLRLLSITHHALPETDQVVQESGHRHAVNAAVPRTEHIPESDGGTREHPCETQCRYEDAQG